MQQHDQAILDYAHGTADAFGLSREAILVLAETEHPGRVIGKLHVQSVARMLHRSGALARGEVPASWR